VIGGICGKDSFLYGMVAAERGMALAPALVWLGVIAGETVEQWVRVPLPTG